MTREQVYKLIDQERDRQTAKWGEQRHDLIEWNAILMEEVGEASREILEQHFDTFYHPDSGRVDRIKKELTQVAAVAVQILEQI